MDNTIDHTFESANRVYDKNGLSPTINTCGGGGLQPKILEDKTIVAMRGRNPDNPSDRTVGAPTEQRLEPNSQGICNTLTSVQKDNLVMEKVFGVTLFESDNFGGWKVNKDELSPTLRAEKVCAGAIETVKIKQATSQGYIDCEVGGVADLSYPDSKTRRGRVQENGQVSPTLMAGEQNICRIEKEIINPLKGISENGWHFEQNVYDANGLVRSVKSESGSGNIPKVIEKYRIRKLTPLECWRLMDFSDEDFNKAAEVNSNTQLYKQAGNSIVRNVLVAILGQMIPGKEDVYRK